jgi:hypothetical protein
MACPYFLPAALLTDAGAGHAVPLGDIYTGSCRAGCEPFVPDTSFQAEYCNFGYARDICGRFPGLDAADAIRFAVGEDAKGLVTIRFARERAHLPHSHGVLEFRKQDGDWRGEVQDTLLAAQAKSYLTSYFRRRPRIE